MLTRTLRRVLRNDTSRLVAQRSARQFLAISFRRTSGIGLSRVFLASQVDSACTYATASKQRAKAAAPPKKAGKPKRGTTKSKAKKKAAPKKPKTTRAKRPQTQDEKERAKASELKKKALLSTKPKPLPSNAWTIYLAENVKGRGPSGIQKQDATNFKSLNAADLERLNQQATENKKANEDAMKRWVNQHTPEQIAAANRGRREIRRMANARRNRGLKPLRGLKPTSLIVDERIPKPPANPIALFNKDRWASGDFKGVSVGEAMKLVVQEWRALSAGEKQRYEDQYRRDKEEYQRAIAA